MARVALYVDGFNLYKGFLESRPALKWLDLEALGRALRPDDELVRVRYCTSKVNEIGDPQRPVRQGTYLRALRSLPLVEVSFGRFETRRKLRQLVYPPAVGDREAWVYQTDEKGSDVNLAMHLILDGVDGLYETAVVISNDSDLEGPIRECRRRFGPVHVVSPHPFGPNMENFSAELQNAATTYRDLRAEVLEAAQFPDDVALPNGKVARRPPSWR